MYCQRKHHHQVHHWVGSCGASAWLCVHSSTGRNEGGISGIVGPQMATLPLLTLFCECVACAVRAGWLVCWGETARLLLLRVGSKMRARGYTPLMRVTE